MKIFTNHSNRCYLGDMSVWRCAEEKRFTNVEHHTVCTVACGPYFQTDCFG